MRLWVNSMILCFRLISQIADLSESSTFRLFLMVFTFSLPLTLASLVLALALLRWSNLLAVLDCITNLAETLCFVRAMMHFRVST